MQNENNNRVPLLDTLIIRKSKYIILDWYQQAINSNRYIHYNSNHSFKVKINVIVEFKSKIKMIYPTLVSKNMNILKIFLKNL